MGRGVTVVLGGGGWCRGCTTGFCRRLLGGAGGSGTGSSSSSSSFFLRPERGPWGQDLSHGPRWPSGAGAELGVGLVNPRGRGPLERVIRSLQNLSPSKRSQGSGWLSRPQHWILGNHRDVSHPSEDPGLRALTVYHFRPVPHSSSSRVRPLSLGRPLPGVCLSQDAGCLPLPLLLAGLPLYQSYLGWMGLKTKAEAGETGE